MSLLQDIAYYLTIKPRLWYLKKLLPEAKIHPTGSRYVCNPPVYGTDIDFLVYSEKYLDTRLNFHGWKETPWKNYGGIEDKKFVSWRKGRTNLIVTSSIKYAETFHTATYLSKKYNLLKKQDKAILHEGLRGNMNPVDSFPNFLSRELKEFIAACNGQYGYTVLKAFRAKHGLESFR